MSEPKRWMDEGPPETIARLLEAASAERPPEASLARALTALGLGASATGAAATAGAATAGATTAGAATSGAAVVSAGKVTSGLAASGLVKWGLAGVALAMASVGGTAVVRHVAARDGAERVHVASHAALAATHDARTHGVTAAASGVSTAASGVSPAADVAAVATSATEPAPDTAPTAADTSVAPEPANRANSVSRLAGRVTHPVPGHVESPLAVNAVNAPKAPSAPNAANGAIDAERLAEEVALVDRARAALARGDAQATLGALDDYDARFSPRRFAPEALYLRMEALLRLGQTSAARAVAARLAKAYPSSPNAARARQVLGVAIP